MLSSLLWLTSTACCIHFMSWHSNDISSIYNCIQLNDNYAYNHVHRYIDSTTHAIDIIFDRLEWNSAGFLVLLLLFVSIFGSCTICIRKRFVSYKFGPTFISIHHSIAVAMNKKKNASFETRAHFGYCNKSKQVNNYE